MPKNEFETLGSRVLDKSLRFSLVSGKECVLPIGRLVILLFLLWQHFIVYQKAIKHYQLLSSVYDEPRLKK